MGFLSNLISALSDTKAAEANLSPEERIAIELKRANTLTALNNLMTSMNNTNNLFRR